MHESTISTDCCRTILDSVCTRRRTTNTPTNIYAYVCESARKCVRSFKACAACREHSCRSDADAFILHAIVPARGLHRLYVCVYKTCAYTDGTNKCSSLFIWCYAHRPCILPSQNTHTQKNSRACGTRIVRERKDLLQSPRTTCS